MAAYLRPRRLEEALAALDRPRAVLAGGTDFYPARVGRMIDEDVGCGNSGTRCARAPVA
jgi:hypothetical protein